MQKLILKPIAKALSKADTNDGSTPDPIIVKFFTPWAGCTWFIVSGTPLDAMNGEPTTVENAKDWHLFGFCDLGDACCAELGYVLLSELESIRGPWGLRIERDTGFHNQSLAKIMGGAPYNREVEAPTPEAEVFETELTPDVGEALATCGQYTVGDEVQYRGDFGQGPLQVATIEDFDEKNGRPLAALDNEHWCYLNQIEQILPRLKKVEEGIHVAVI